MPGCARRPVQSSLPEVNAKLELEARLSGANFSIVQSDLDAVQASWEALTQSTALPDPWPIQFAGTQVEIPPLDPGNAVGIDHTDGRRTVVYLFPDASKPPYGQFSPLAVAHYMIPEPKTDIVLLLVCFQSDSQRAMAGLGVRSLDPAGEETSAPFALAAGPSDLAGKFFYDEFIESSKREAVAARSEWDRGFLLLTRFDPDTILSTYLPWY